METGLESKVSYVNRMNERISQSINQSMKVILCVLVLLKRELKEDNGN